MLFAVLHYNFEATSANRMFGFSLLLPVAGAIVYRGLNKSHQTYAAWRTFASRIGFACRVGGWPPRPVIDGVHRGRQISISATRRGAVRVLITQIRVELRQDTQTVMRIWGPLDEETLSAELTRNPTAWCFGRNKTFLLHSNRQQSNVDPFPAKTRARLQRLNAPTNIIVSEGVLLFEQTGIIHNEAELAEQIDLLSDIAYSISEWDIARK